MTLLELLKRYEIFNVLKSKFPGMIDRAGEINVIPWNKEFNVADRNPEVIETIEFLDILLKNGMITEQDYTEQVRRISTGYASKTLAIAFIGRKEVSFRSEVPDQNVVLHELGHIYFNVNDLIWSASYGGGEILFHLALKEKYNITEKNIRRYHTLLKQIYENAEEVHRVITDSIAHRLDVYPHLFTICIFAGYIPDIGAHITPEISNDLKSEEWAQVPVMQHHLFSFFQNMMDGLKYRDSIWVSFAKWLKIIMS